ncbi:U3 snoRNP protein [Imshaugia aleurites]|uniref:U3 small nucleolar ribonucleoprotein protein MPP10 n=1 Tax=Imshaugia aleurites TaxID=172621 RepID=A0A8H3EX43_9LECA|nr:U3 snoRNP protein [Imshaugia aleurites]
MAPMAAMEYPAVASTNPAAVQILLSTLESSSHTFLQPTPSLHAASLVLAKRYLDPLALSTSEAQAQRQQVTRRKRKRGDYDANASRKPLQLTQVHLEGFRVEQIWQQARRILDATRFELERSLPAKSQIQEPASVPEEQAGDRESNRKSVKFLEFDEDGFEIGSSDPDKLDDEDNMSSGELDGSPNAANQPQFVSEEAHFGHIVDDDHEDMLDGEGMGGEEDSDELSESEEVSKEVFHPDRNGLNDGFFSIDDFNRQSEFLEQQDARGENDGAASDEEDVDWDVDPLALTSSGNIGRILEDEAMEYSDEELGPTFGNVDSGASNLSDDDANSANGGQLDDIGAINNTNDIKYADFFAPPPSKASNPSRRRPLPKTQPPPQQATEDDVQRTISAVRRDIFEDDLTPDEDEAPSDPNDRRSSHQRRQAALTAEIRRLEAASVAKRDWTLSGEARAADRPINSLLEEDLDFERAGKPIPVITQEVSEDIEALIKRRIIAREFDEVIRRRPANLATGNVDMRRGRFELDDTKPQQSLAEMYEAEHLKTVDPEGYVDKRDEKLKREHAKIEQMWKDISAKLDALSSWHYKPKPPSASINVVADVPTISIEDARPAAGGEVGGESMLAPQEVYKPDERKMSKEEVLKKGSGLPIGREEMTRDEKVRRRRREKERIRKAGGLAPAKGLEGRGKKAEEKRGVIGDLKKGGVRVIGKKGEIRDVEGKAVQGKVAAGKGAGGYKL